MLFSVVSRAAVAVVRVILLCFFVVIESDDVDASGDVDEDTAAAVVIHCSKAALTVVVGVISLCFLVIDPDDAEGSGHAGEGTVAAVFSCCHCSLSLIRFFFVIASGAHLN